MNFPHSELCDFFFRNSTVFDSFEVKSKLIFFVDLQKKNEQGFKIYFKKIKIVIISKFASCTLKFMSML